MHNMKYAKYANIMRVVKPGRGNSLLRIHQ